MSGDLTIGFLFSLIFFIQFDHYFFRSAGDTLKNTHFSTHILSFVVIQMDSTKSHRIDINLVELIRISTNKSVLFLC